MKIQRVEGISGKGKAATYQVVEFSILIKRCKESNRKEMVGLKEKKKKTSGLSRLSEQEGIKL